MIAPLAAVKVVWLVAAGLLLAFLVWRFTRLSKERRIIGGVIVVGAAVYGSGVVELPNIEELIKDIGATLGKWTYLVVPILAFLETGAFIGLIAPGETAIMLGGVVAGQGEISLVVLIGLVWFAAVLGDTTSFMLGRKLGRGFLERHGPKVKITEERLQWVEKFFEKRGGATILIGRFVGLARALAPFIAGSSRMSYAKFIPYDVIGAGIWSATFCVLGYVFWQSLSTLLSAAKQGALALGTTIVVIVGAVVAYRFLRQPDNREKTKAWFAVQAEKPVIKPVVRALTPVYRGVVEPLWRRAQAPLRFGWERFTPGGLGLELTTTVAVGLVGGATFVSLVVLLNQGELTTLDNRSLQLADDLRTGVLVDVAKVFDFLGTAPVVGAVVVIATIYLLARRLVFSAITLFVASGITYAGIGVVRRLEDRPRPSSALVETMGSAFPANHAAYAAAYVAIAVMVARVTPNWAGRAALVIVSIVLAVVIGLSDVYLRANTLSDVLAGWGFGAFAFALGGTVALIVGYVRHNGDPGASPPGGDAREPADADAEPADADAPGAASPKAEASPT